jgi:hypothetical protein
LDQSPKLQTVYHENKEYKMWQDRPNPIAEVLARIEAETGPEGRRAFENFLKESKHIKNEWHTAIEYYLALNKSAMNGLFVGTSQTTRHSQTMPPLTNYATLFGTVMIQSRNNSRAQSRLGKSMGMQFMLTGTEAVTCR